MSGTSPAAGSVRFGVLGPTVADFGDGRSLDLGPRRRRELLTLLLLRPGAAVTMDALADELWHGEPPPAARSTLQAHLSALRRVLEPGAGAPYRLLVTRGPAYLIAAGAMDLDSGRFDESRALARRARAAGDVSGARAHLERALALWRGEPFADLEAHAAAEATRVRLAEDRATAEADLLAVRLDLGEHDGIVGELRVFAERHPSRERAYALLATALYRGGRQAEALDALRAARRALAGGLGLEPGPELRDLETRILRQDPALAGPRALATGPAPARPEEDGGPGLLGRDGELAALTRAWERAVASRSVGIAVVRGPAGIGKTRLVEELARSVRAEVRWGRCTQVSGAPAYWPWRQLLRGLPADVVGAFGAGRDTDGPARFEVALAIGRHLADLAAAGPVLAMLEDLHWADAASMAVLEILATELRDVPLLLVCTLRPEPPAAPDTSGAGPVSGEQPRRLLGVLARHPALVRTELAGLAPPEVDQLFRAVSGAALTEASAAAVRERTAGNPFFVVELARLAAATSVERATAPGALPAGVRDAVLARLAAMPAAMRRLLGTMAVAGREAALPVVATAARLTQAEALDALDTAVAADLAEAPSPGRARFTHDLVRDAVLAGLGAGEHARLSGLVADALVAHQGAALPAAVLAHHLRAAAAGRVDARAARAQLAAAREALAQFAFEDAAAFAGQGLDLAPGGEVSLVVDLMTALGAARRRYADHAEAQRVLAEAARLAATNGDPVRAALATLARAGDAVGGYSSLFYSPAPGLVADLEAAAAALPADEGARRVRLLTAAAVRACYDDADTASRVIGLAAAAARAGAPPEPGELADPEAAGPAEPAGLLVARALAAWTPQHASRRLALADALLARAGGPAGTELVARHLRRAALWELGDVAGADAESAVFTRRLGQTRDPDFDLLDRCWQAMRHLHAGRYGAAGEVAALLATPRPEVTTGAVTLLTQSVGTIHGLTAWDRGAMSQLLPQMEDLEEQVIAEWALIRALALVENGRGPAAATEVRRLVRPDLADVPAGVLEPVYVVNLAEIIAQLDEPAPDLVERAHALLDRLTAYGDTLVTFIPGLVCMGPAALYRGGLALALGRVDEAIGQLRAALELAGAAGGVPFAVRARRRLALALRRAGHEAEAADLDRAAARDAAAIGMRLPYLRPGP
ncbi:AAA family ATPase [Frankia sp. CNm7]|uniref:AAA family ATPase n=1 Tax=Frankia nepalensis TaxID=1836974 RepID=A0A937REB1_9ACTN|nr:BTAD domain-containing putative transcriptional regulator [Frankia nepalensis]MBL7499218.1 AAA family ATPase [Frankia nepalensis]MBL7520907.1 AAA family ATPase [Frankia nepalensis]MBL7627289.1 AAA family ATPase [Frankia nepalensis]